MAKAEMRIKLIIDNYGAWTKKIQRMQKGFKILNKLICDYEKRMEKSFLIVKPRGKHPFQDAIEWKEYNAAMFDPARDIDYKEMFHSMVEEQKVRKGKK